jgi:hypothetical protein
LDADHPEKGVLFACRFTPERSAPPAPPSDRALAAWGEAEWAEALAQLGRARPPGDVPPRRWLSFIRDCDNFLRAGWAARAVEFGWGPTCLFGCHKERPFARLDCAGLLWLVNGGAIVELHRDRAIIETAGGARRCFRRRPVELGRVVLAWELGTGCQK